MKFKIGSQVFFNSYSDYTPHDKDFISFDSPFKNICVDVKGKEEEVFEYRPLSKEEFIEYELQHCSRTPMAVGKLLVPEVCDYMGITLEELKQFEFAFENIDDKHKYEKVIYDSYLQNNSFTLTEEQRSAAYAEYKKYRSEIYKS
jgi:hypothetical protein